MMVQQFGWLLLLFAVLTFAGLVPFPNLILSGIGFLIGLVITFAFEGVVVNLKERKIKEYFGLFGIKLGRWKSIPDLTEVVYTSGRYSQQIHAVVSRRQVDSRIYRAFLKGPGNYKQIFASGTNGTRIMHEARQAAEAFHLPATNYTVKPPVKIF